MGGAAPRPGRLDVRALLILLVLGSGAPARAEYGFPIEDPYEATVIGTPRAYRAPVPDRIPVRVRTLRPFEDRPIPRVFWNQRGFRYSIALQPEPAPLVFVIAGTGAHFSSAKMVFLQKALFQAGLSVANVTSPTFPEFVTTASGSSVPGNTEADVRDLYAVMKRIRAEVEGRADITGYALTGYSLGGTQAAFLARLDEEEGAFGFRKVLMINPSVSLFTSVRILDAMLEEAIPNGAPDLQRIINDFFSRLSSYFQSHGRAPIDNELLYNLARTDGLPREKLRTLISVAFRISSASMLFASDVSTGSGHVVEKGVELGPYDSTTPYMKVAARWTFENYLDDVLTPYWSGQDSRWTREALIEKGALPSIEGWLRAAEHVHVMHNVDDLILGPGDLEFLERTFARRLELYPRGGHCGNLEYRENVEHMLGVLTSGGAE